MDEFDQFVLHDSMQKKMKEVLGSEPPCRTSKDETRIADAVNDCQIIEHENVVDSTAMNINATTESAGPSSEHTSKEHEIDTDMVDEEKSHEVDEIVTDEEEAEIDKYVDEEYMFPTPEEINKACPPSVGMTFPTLEQAVRFVNVYGQLSCFAVIKGRNYKHRKIFLNCNKGRRTISSVTGPRQRKRRTIDRTGCAMNVTVELIDGIWHIISCNMEHNHDLVTSPSLTKFFLSHQNMTEEEIMLSKLLQEMRIKPKGIMKIFRKLRGNFGNIMFGTKKLDNMKQEERQRKKNSDIECTLKYIEKIQLDKPGFCYKMEVDGEGAVRSIFWTDARSRLDYKLYGDIISFDTTYSTNRYNMPFAPILGINGHGRTIVFGWALLKNEKADTFKWLFETLVEVMEGKKPKIVLTDQDSAMKRAVPWVFPLAFHRFCIWHVLQKMREHLAVYMSKRDGMEADIMRLIMQLVNIAEFEEGWKQMEVKYDCAAHDHIVRMWEHRSLFVPAYFQGKFCPFTRSTSRSEEFNSNFKDYVKRKDTIETFLKQYELFQENIIEIENKDRFESTQKIPVYIFRQPIERHAGRIYTKGIYSKFVTELVNSTAFAVDELEKDKLYRLRKIFRYERPEFYRDSFTVNVDRSIMKFQCECGKFERDGILCCHILRLFTQFDVIEIPGQYIVPRWTSEFREKQLLKHKEEIIAIHGNNSAQNALRYAMLMNGLSDMCSDISRDESKCKEFIEEVHKIHARLMSGDAQKAQETLTLRDPPVIRKKSTKIAKNSIEETPGSMNTTASDAQQEKQEQFFNISNFGSTGNMKQSQQQQQDGSRTGSTSAGDMSDKVVQITEREENVPKSKKPIVRKSATSQIIRDPPV